MGKRVFIIICKSLWWLLNIFYSKLFWKYKLSVYAYVYLLDCWAVSDAWLILLSCVYPKYTHVFKLFWKKRTYTHWMNESHIRLTHFQNLKEIQTINFLWISYWFQMCMTKLKMYQPMYTNGILIYYLSFNLLYCFLLLSFW